MVYTMQYDSPIGKIFLGADKIGLTGLWFYGDRLSSQVQQNQRRNILTCSKRTAKKSFVRLLRQEQTICPVLQKLCDDRPIFLTVVFTRYIPITEI